MKPIPASHLSRVTLVIAAGLALAGCPQKPPVAPPEGPGPLNDTGITTCSDADSNGLACGSVPAYPGQDAQYGRDATADDDSDGHAGFRFTKLGADGQPLAIQGAAWDEGGSQAAGTRWSCVRDEVTGRTWEVKDNDPASLHYKDHTYGWYNPDPATQGGAAGSSGSGDCNGTLPVSGAYTGCDTYTFPRFVNENGGLCGFKNWRVPEIQELRSIVDLGVPFPGPTVDSDYFPNMISYAVGYGSLWTATPSPYDGGGAWRILFSYGLASQSSKSGSHHGAVLVRGGP